MANNFESNFTRKLMEKVIASFETKRVLSKSVNTQLFDGKFNPSTGTQIDIQRPTDYQSSRTATGDISSSKEDIITGKATATVQNYITVAADFNEADEALKMGNNQTRFFDDMADRIVTDLEVDFANFMVKNAGLLAGTYGTAVTTWSDVANAGALLRETGVPMNECYYAMNSFTEAVLADKQTQLGGGITSEVSNAFRSATIKEQYAGFNRVMSATALGRVDNPAVADKVGALASNPDVTYVTAKDSMTQALAVSGMTTAGVIKAGQVVTIAGRYRLNNSTKQLVLDASGSPVLWSAVVTADVTLSGGAGTLVVSGPAIYEAGGAYNTVDSAPVATDVVTVLGLNTATTYQPNMFWNRDAYSIASVKMQKLYSTDTLAKTSDGLMLRCSKYADGDANKQTIRFDLRPAYAVLNPLMAGHGFG